MSFDLFQFSFGNIVYDEFHIDFSKDYLSQLNSLNEDLLQVKFGEKYILDIGWYPEHNCNGNFIVQVIQDGNWESPIYKNTCFFRQNLIRSLTEATGLVNSLVDKNITNIKLEGKENGKG